MAAGENEAEGSTMGSTMGGSLSLAEPVACAGSSSPLLCSDTILRDGQQSEQLCVVCHYFPLSRALLPCRHTCICAVCFCKYLGVECGANVSWNVCQFAHFDVKFLVIASNPWRRIFNDHTKHSLPSSSSKLKCKCLILRIHNQLIFFYIPREIIMQTPSNQLPTCKQF